MRDSLNDLFIYSYVMGAALSHVAVHDRFLATITVFDSRDGDN
jgi:hypothetical protein